VTGSWQDDDQVLAWLAEAEHEARTVPAEFLATGRAAYGWHDLDAELLRLAQDSADGDVDDRAQTGGRPLAGVRTGPGARRALTFESDRFTIEMEFDRTSLHGQLFVAGGSLPAEVDLQVATGETVTASVDELGYFTLRPVPAGPFRLRCTIPDGPAAVTSWIAP
jgi:hypothetical protein